MRVYLMQHGKPVSKEENPERPLSREGTEDVKKMAAFFQRCGVRVEEAFHSGKARAEQTAGIMTAVLNPNVKPVKKGGLSPMDEVKETAQWLEGCNKALLIAGHLPHLAKLTSFLVTRDENTLVAGFQQGGVVCIEKGEEGAWSIAWMLVPELISNF